MGSRPCACCQSGDPQPHLDGLLRCTKCGHVWVGEGLTDDEVRALYSEQYFSGAEYYDYEKQERALVLNFRRRIAELVKRRPGGGRLWEIGAAYGFFLREASEHFQVAGCDISDSAARYARERLGLEVSAIDYLDWECPEPFDVICMWDTIEHLRDPRAYVAKAAADMRSGGLIGLSTGDIGSLAARLRGKNWRLLHFPTHLHYFTGRSMTALLTALGFGDVEIGYPAFWRDASAVGYELFGRSRHSMARAAYKALQSKGLLDFCFPFNLFDTMTVYARKKADGPRPEEQP